MLSTTGIACSSVDINATSQGNGTTRAKKFSVSDNGGLDKKGVYEIIRSADMTYHSSIFIQDTNDKNGEMGIDGGGKGYSTLISDWKIDARGRYDESGRELRART